MEIIKRAKEWLDQYKPASLSHSKIAEASPIITNPLAALKEEQAEVTRLRDALEPFANYACDPPCGCHNCIVKSVLDLIRDSRQMDGKITNNTLQEEVK